MIRMNDSMKNEQFQPPKTNAYHSIVSFAALSIAAAIGTGAAGCRGTSPAFSQAFSGLSAPARVPPPAQGSFQVPGSYSGAVGTSANPASNGLGGSSFSNGPKTSQNSLPTSSLVDRISNAQSQLLNASNNARNSVNRAADGINSSVEQASARVDRFGQGVVQASAILSEAATTPVVGNTSERNSTFSGGEQAPNTSISSGRIGDSDQSENANWRTPVRR